MNKLNHKQNSLSIMGASKTASRHPKSCCGTRFSLRRSHVVPLPQHKNENAGAEMRVPMDPSCSEYVFAGNLALGTRCRSCISCALSVEIRGGQCTATFRVRCRTKQLQAPTRLLCVSEPGTRSCSRVTSRSPLFLSVHQSCGIDPWLRLP